MPAQDQHYYAHGKLLLTAEYLVLDGAKALAIPTQQGQSLHISSQAVAKDQLNWLSNRADGSQWFEVRFQLPKLEVAQTTDKDKAHRLQQILRAAIALRPDALHHLSGCLVTTHLEFPTQWGLGSSSTLISNLARWLQLSPYDLLARTFGGSGYDLACATADGPIFYQRDEPQPIVQPIAFTPAFADQLYFVYQEQKQDSRAGIQRYRNRAPHPASLLAKISSLTEAIATAPTLSTFADLLHEHEAIISDLIGLPPIQSRLFPDYWGQTKSLGAWGGDFLLATSTRSQEETMRYFIDREFPVVVSYGEMVWIEE